MKKKIKENECEYIKIKSKIHLNKNILFVAQLMSKEFWYFQF